MSKDTSHALQAAVQPHARSEAAQIQDLDSQLFASLLPNVVKLYQLAASSLEPDRHLEIAKLATIVKESLARAQKQAREMPGADLTIQDQEEIIAILEEEVKKRKR